MKIIYDVEMKPIRVLFVCLGNICRSPLAEGVLLNLLKEVGRESDFVVDSAGTASYHVGDPPDSRACQVANRHGFPLNHSGRQFEVSDFSRFDFILVMDESNLREVLSLAGSEFQFRKKVQLFSNFDFEKKFPKNVPDPYYGDASDFEKVYEQLLACSQGFLKTLPK